MKHTLLSIGILFNGLFLTTVAASPASTLRKAFNQVSPPPQSITKTVDRMHTSLVPNQQPRATSLDTQNTIQRQAQPNDVFGRKSNEQKGLMEKQKAQAQTLARQEEAKQKRLVEKQNQERAATEARMRDERLAQEKASMEKAAADRQQAGALQAQHKQQLQKEAEDKLRQDALQQKTIETPHGIARQANTPAAHATLSEVQSGATIYRQGQFGVQNTANAQFWSMQNPATTNGYANQMGMPGGAAKPDWIMGGKHTPPSPVITRPAPRAPEMAGNDGGSMEAVVPPGGIKIEFFHMVD